MAPPSEAQPQQPLCPLQAFLVGGGEVAASAPDGLGLGDVEGSEVIMHRIAVFQLRRPVGQEVVDVLGTQQVGPSLGFVESRRQRIAHIGHHGEVQELRDVHLVVEPAAVGGLVLSQQLLQFAPVQRVGFAAAPRGFGHRHLRLLLDPVSLQSTFGAPLVGRRHRLACAAEDTAERKNQPPEVLREVKQRFHSIQVR